MPIKSWNTDAVVNAARGRVTSGMKKAMAYAVGRVRVKINRGNPTGDFPSLPGEPPKKVTGQLFASITSKVEQERDEVVGTYGSGIVYARILELGYHGTNAAGQTVNFPARPYLRPVLNEDARAMVQLIARG